MPPAADPVKPRPLISYPVMAPASSRWTKSALPRASRRQVPAKRGSRSVSKAKTPARKCALASVARAAANRSAAERVAMGGDAGKT